MLTVLTDSQRVDAVRARGAGVRGSATIIIKKVKLEEDKEEYWMLLVQPVLTGQT